MDNYIRNRDEWIIRVLIIGLFLFVFTVFNNNDCQTYTDNTITNSAVSGFENNAILITPSNLPDFDNSLVTSDNSYLKYKVNNDFSGFILNNIINTEFNFCTKRYLKIKPLRYNIANSFIYSSNQYEEYPAIA
ncbi:MAG: hypothetical protein KAT68_06595 [Bacteroidales bacterium]|nr:hypothetical protein [Bacteroidales bacterium]